MQVNSDIVAFMCEVSIQYIVVKFVGVKSCSVATVATIYTELCTSNSLFVQSPRLPHSSCCTDVLLCMSSHSPRLYLGLHSPVSLLVCLLPRLPFVCLFGLPTLLSVIGWSMNLRRHFANKLQQVWFRAVHLSSKFSSKGYGPRNAEGTEPRLLRMPQQASTMVMGPGR